MLTALVLPMRCYQVLPIAVMLGAIFTLFKIGCYQPVYGDESLALVHGSLLPC